MDEPGIKAQPRRKPATADAAAPAASAGNGAEATGEQRAEERDELRDKLHDIGRQLLDSTKVLSDEVARQARIRPLAVFGAAFVAGIVIARALRR